MKKSTCFLQWLLILGFVFLITDIYAQTGGIKGKVSDASGETIVGASILIEGTTKGTTTDIDGNYLIENIDAGQHTFVFSFIGLKTQQHILTINAKETMSFNVVLKEDAEVLDEVVVIGYGRRQKRDVTGSIESIKAKDMADGVIPSFEQAIQGRAAGVQVTASNGVAGSPVKISIRGTSSISAGSEPLYVVDGIPITSGDYGGTGLGAGTSALADLNPNDIESIDILKDAAAASIYGSRGSNGVVIITTKKGTKGKTKFNAGYFQGMITETNRLDFLNATEHLDLLDRARAEQGLEPMDSGFVVYNYRNWTRHQADSLAALGGTDWIDKVLRVGSVKEANLSASGGSEKTLFYVGGTYKKEDGFLVGNSFERINGRLNLETHASDKLKIGTNVGLSFITNDRVPIGDAGGLGKAQQMLPYVPVYNEDGSFFDPYNNPIWQLENKTYEAKIFRSLTNLYADYKIFEGLNFRTEFGLDVMSQVEDEFNFRNIEDPLSTSSAWDRRTDIFNWTTNNYFSYNKIFKEIHDASLTLGNSMQKSSTSGVGLFGYDFVNDYFTKPGAASPSKQSGYTYHTGYGFVSNFFRANYKLKDKYLASFSIRNDGSSRFGENVRYGWFPSFSAGWIITDEPFMDSISLLSFLKIRASIGQTGNANIGDFTWRGSAGPSGGYNGQQAIVPYSLPNPYLTWEKATQSDITLEYALLQNRFAGTFTYYYKYTYAMLLEQSLPPSTGYSSIMVNVGDMKNYGFEITFSSKNLTKKFTWSTDFNFSINRNVVISINDLPPDAFESGQPGEGRVLVDYPVGQAFVVEYAGVADEDYDLILFDPNGNNIDTVAVTAGQALYYDLDGNLITSNSPYFYDFRKPLGSPTPKFIGGITNTFGYKGFDLNFLFSFVYGTTLYDDPAKRQIGDYNNIAQRYEVLDSWTVDNPNSEVPALGSGGSTNSSRFLYDASFIRLRNVSFGYKLPQSYCEKIRIQSMRIYITATNLWTWTKYPGWDPEVLRNVDPNSQQGNVSFAGPSFQTPQAKTVSVGIQLSF